ncbi:hypothetical protein [Labrys miyagiensis]|uniref:hypothetical protein n=1 Tax=Labrys miyagiensis TaxID=346912 RepID=UPI0024E145E1|nr:hypothetical protein [Labrys miyagiensis]
MITIRVWPLAGRRPVSAYPKHLAQAVDPRPGALPLRELHQHPKVMMAEHNVILKDRDGYETVNYPIGGMSAARKHAKYLLSEEFAKSFGFRP